MVIGLWMGQIDHDSSKSYTKRTKQSECGGKCMRCAVILLVVFG